MNPIKKQMAEDATGCRENPHGLGKLYTSSWNDNGMVCPGGDEIESTAEAYDLLREGRGISVPNAGAGSYRKVLSELGFSEVKTYEDSSSAGDWTFAVKDGPDGDWYVAFQENRYPYHGFTYHVDFEWGFPTFEALCEFKQ